MCFSRPETAVAAVAGRVLRLAVSAVLAPRVRWLCGLRTARDRVLPAGCARNWSSRCPQAHLAFCDFLDRHAARTGPVPGVPRGVRAAGPDDGRDRSQRRAPPYGICTTSSLILRSVGARQGDLRPLLNESASINNLASRVNDSARRRHHIARQRRSPQRKQAGSGRAGRRTPRADRLCLRQGK